jgi:hypothetical protein
MKAEDGYWLAGLVDGEGCFFAHAWHPSTRPHSTNIQIQMTVGLRADDKPVLEHRQAITGLGRLHFIRQGAACRWQWTVIRKKERLVLVEIFDQYPLRSKKAADYAIWRELAIEHSTWIHGQKPVAARLAKAERLILDLRAGREYNPEHEPTEDVPQ